MNNQGFCAPPSYGAQASVPYAAAPSYGAPYGANPALVPALYGASQSPYGASQALYGASQALYGASQASYGASQASYGASQASYDASQAPNGASQVAYGASQAAYGASQGPYGSSQGPYGASQAAYAASQSPYGASQAPYAASQSPYTASQSPYGASQAPYAASQSPYGASQGAYGASQVPYAASQGPYGASQAPYGAAAVPYGSLPYAYQPLPSGAPQPQYGAEPAAFGAAPPTSSATTPQTFSTPAAHTATSEQQRPQTGKVSSKLKPQPSAPPLPVVQPAPSYGGSPAYPTHSAPHPLQTATTSASGTSVQPGLQRPSSAYTTSTTSTPASVQPAAAINRPASAAPAPGVYAHANAPHKPQRMSANHTFGQRPQTAAAPVMPYMPPITYTPMPGHSVRRRRAVLVGCSYPGSTSALNGCLNDVKCIQFCLKQRFGFADEQIVVLRDDGRHPDFTPTKANIIRALKWLMTDQRYGDSLFFHFSGHGSQQCDRNGDEEDGYDETICPTDFKQAGQIVDDELNRLLIRPLLPGVTLNAVIDACHSGTALDLPFRAKVDSEGRCYWKGQARYDKTTAGGTAYQFGACTDSQVAQDTKNLSGHAYTGAATYCFIQAIEKYGVDQTYGQILSHMTSTLRDTTGGPVINLGSAGSLIAGFLLGSVASVLTSGGQTPVLSCDKQVDISTIKLSL